MFFKHHQVNFAMPLLRSFSVIGNLFYKYTTPLELRHGAHGVTRLTPFVSPIKRSAGLHPALHVLFSKAGCKPTLQFSAFRVSYSAF